jgi:hypothetical protein
VRTAGCTGGVVEPPEDEDAEVDPTDGEADVDGGSANG